VHDVIGSDQTADRIWQAASVADAGIQYDRHGIQESEHPEE
jgi:hypothetical protein